MEKLDKKAIATALVKYFIVNCFGLAILLLCSGNLLWTGAWTIFGFALFYIAVTLTIGIKYFPEIVSGRSENKYEHSWDKIAVMIYSAGFYLLYIIAGFDSRYSWSSLHTIFFIIGLILYSFAMINTFWILASNPYAVGASRIQKERNQRVISHGPYRFIRHPMYFNVIIFAVGTPLLLESVWALIPAPIIIGSFIYRCYKEDTLLQNELEGYKEYSNNVKYRMIPFIW